LGEISYVCIAYLVLWFFLFGYESASRIFHEAFLFLFNVSSSYDGSD
jgi:hypothetical protein